MTNHLVESHYVYASLVEFLSLKLFDFALTETKSVSVLKERWLEMEVE